MQPPLTRAPAALILLTCCIASVASAAVKVEGLTPLKGPTVRPRIVSIGALPRITAPYTGPIHEKTEGINPEAEAELERLKQHPAEIRPDQLVQLTIDTGAALAPVVGNGFEGITQGGYIPSEPTVAGGPLNIFSAGNSSVTITNKDGSNQVEINGRTFFGVTAGEGAISDAQCYYDTVHGRFVAIAFTQGTSPNYSSFYLAISQTTDARGAWYTYKFDMTLDGNVSTANWGDYEGLGISEDKLCFSSQQFRFADNTYAHQKIRVIDRALAYNGSPVSYVDFVAFTAPSGQQQDVFVTKPARDLTPGDSTIHCLCVRTNGGTNVTYRTVTGPPSARVLSAGNLVGVSAYGAPPDAEQLGSTSRVVTNDCRPSDFYVRDGVLIIAWHTAATINGTGVSAVRLLRLRTNDRTVLTDETYGAASTYYYFPTATVDSVGTIFLGFDRSSSTEYPSAYATGKRRVDASLQPSALLKAGLAPNLEPRWGDFTGIDNDASLSGPGGSTAWYAGQWTKTSFVFGTWINRLSFPYGQISGTVTDDCDGTLATTGDRGPIAGVTLTLMQGATSLATTLTNASGNYNFGYLESGVYDVVVTPPGGAALDAITGTGGTSQTRVSASDLQVNLTNAQTSSSNNFIVSSTHPVPVTSNVSPTSKIVGSAAFTLTVNGSSFTRCSGVRFDGGARTTTYGSANQLTAQIPASDLAATGIHTITVVTPGPGGGTSNGQTFTVMTGTDVTPPTVTVTAPVGGESWPVGSVHAIGWTATDNVGVANVDLDYSTNGGASFANAIAHGISNTGSYAWTVPGTPSTTVRVRVLARDADGNVAADSSHANLTIAGWTITATAGANGAISPSGAVGVADGATPAFTISPNTGYSVADVLVNGVSVGAVSSYTFAPVHSNQTIAASFTINRYTLNVTTVGSGTVGKSPDQPLYDHGTLVTLTATPGAGSSFQGWSGDATGATNPLSVTMTSNQNITATFYQHIYTWSATGTAAWGTATNWTPARTTPAADDVLLFGGGGAVTVTGVTTQTIARLIVSNNTSATLQAPAFATLTLAGGSATDLDVQAGSTLRLGGTSQITLALASGATGSVSGTVDVISGPHRLNALDPNALEFQAGSAMTLGTGFSGSVFGTGTGTSALNSVVFHNGSLLAQSAGSNPFGATAPSSVVTFEHGSRYRFDAAAVSPALAGRTYADFEQNASGSIAPTGGAPFTIDSLIVSRGALTLNISAGGTVRGDINVKSGAGLSINPISAASFTLAGGTTQTLNFVGSLNTSSFTTVVVDNPSGVVLGTSVTLGGSLTFVTGRITTGPNMLALTSGSISGASQSDGYVDGTLRLSFPAGSSTRTYDIGDATTYTPVTVAMNGAGSGFDMSAVTHTPDHPNIGSSGLDPSKSVNRYWTLSPILVPAFTSYDVTFEYRSNSYDPTADPLHFGVRLWKGSWSPLTAGTLTATTTQAVGVLDFGDFIVADTLNLGPTVTVRMPKGNERLLIGDVVNMNWTASGPAPVNSIDVLLSRSGSPGPFSPLATGLPNTSSYSWLVTGPATNAGVLEVVAHDASARVGSDLSDTTFTISSDPTAVESGPITQFALSPVWPDPVQRPPVLRFALPHASRVRLSVMDLQGREVAVAAEGEFAAGRHEARLPAGRRDLVPGLYFALLRVAGQTLVHRFVVTQ